MKFLIPPAKEMRTHSQGHHVSLPDKSQPILKILAQVNPSELEKIYKIKSDAAKIEAQHLTALQNGKALSYPALELFNGLMYRQIDRDLTKLDIKFTREHIFITSAFYGIINALADIAEHRLDFNCKIQVNGRSLKNYWRPVYDDFLKSIMNNEPVISLLSSEFESVFSPQLAKSLIRITFQEESAGQLKTHSTISKKGRGQLLNQIIKQKIQTTEALKTVNFSGFSYRQELSTDQHLVFIKTVE